MPSFAEAVRNHRTPVSFELFDESEEEEERDDENNEEGDDTDDDDEEWDKQKAFEDLAIRWRAEEELMSFDYDEEDYYEYPCC